MHYGHGHGNGHGLFILATYYDSMILAWRQNSDIISPEMWVMMSRNVGGQHPIPSASADYMSRFSFDGEEKTLLK
jgi:hypothetical protein